MKKKLLSLALALVLSWSLSAPALAAQMPSIVWLEDGLKSSTDAEFHDGLAPVSKFVEEEAYRGGVGSSITITVSKYGYVDKSGKVVIPLEYDLAWDFSDGMAIVGKNIDNTTTPSKNYGFINTAGQIVVPIEYDWVQPFHDGFALVLKNKKYGYVDKTGQIVLPLEYSSAGDFSEGLAPVYKNGQWSFIDTTGKVVLVLEEQYSRVSSFYNGVALVARQEGSLTPPKYGYIDRSGKEIVPVIYDYAFNFSEGLGRIGIVDPADSNRELYGYVDTTGNVVIPLEYSEASDFSEGVAVVCGGASRNYKWGAIDSNGNIVIPFNYAVLEDFHSGLARAATQTNIGYINLNNQVVVSFDYASVENFSEGAAFVTKYIPDQGTIDGIMTIPGYSAPQQTAQPETPAPPTKFTDVAAGSPFVDAINWAVDQGITTGKTATSFAPGENCTTGQILTFLWRANGSPEPTINNPFTDSISASFQKAAVWAYETGLVSGTTFGASTPCTRAATVEYLWKAAGSPAASENASFSDVPTSADYAQAVAWAVENGITSGTGNGQSFSPDSTCTRGQIVTFLYRAMGQ